MSFLGAIAKQATTVVKQSTNQDPRRYQEREKRNLDVLSWQRGYQTRASSGIEGKEVYYPIRLTVAGPS
jgi:hypothetical protein